MGAGAEVWVRVRVVVNGVTLDPSHPPGPCLSTQCPDCLKTIEFLTVAAKAA